MTSVTIVLIVYIHVCLMAGFVPDRPRVQIGTIFYERTENTIVIKVIKQFFCDTHDKPKAHDHGEP